MLKRIKYIVLLLCMLISVNQSIHIIGHIFSSHDDTQSELVHINDHKCQLCHIDVKSLLPDSEQKKFTWFDAPKHTISYLFITPQQYKVANPFFSLRAPPVLI